MLGHSSKKCWAIYEKYYKHIPTSDVIYKRLIKKYISEVPESIVFDAGCGRHLNYVQFVAPLVKFTIGCDLIEDFNYLKDNSSYIAIRANILEIPVEDKIIKTIICRSVFEHLECPHAVLKEFNRILKYSGTIIFMTPNLYDYVSIIAKITPHRFHQWLLNKYLGWDKDDIFPTFYRFNTERRIKRIMSNTGFECKELLFISHYPVYLMFTPLLFRIGIYYERLIRRFESFRFLRGSIVGIFEKVKSI